MIVRFCPLMVCLLMMYVLALNFLKGNKFTHNLAQHALCISDFVVGMEDVPPPFLSVVLADIVGFYFF